MSQAESRETSKVTPMMQQYLDTRKRLSENTLLLFRLGDFYEMFLEDAEEGARILGITLTRRHETPMAGIPYHAAEAYISKLLAAGKKVAICEQMEAPQPGKLVKRALTRILSPGTTLQDNQVEAQSNHYLLALHADKRGLHAAWLDLTTGTFKVATDKDPTNLIATCHTLQPREAVIAEGAYGDWQALPGHDTWLPAVKDFLHGIPVSSIRPSQFDTAGALQALLKTLNVMNLQGFGIAHDHPALGAAAALIYYATENLCAPPQNVHRLQEHQCSDVLLMDPSTLANLEIFRSASHTRKGSLIAAMDGTVTAPGARLLESWLAAPILDCEILKERQECVGSFIKHPGAGSDLQDYLKSVRDIPRILGRLQNRIRTPRELGGIRDTLLQLPMIREILSYIPETPVTRLSERIEGFDDLRELLQSALVDELPTNFQDGGYIRDGLDEELDRMRGLIRESQTWILDLEQQERERTGIKNLKIKFNNAFGYFIEVTKSNVGSVPFDYIRKQTMKNAERYYTETLKDKEREILSAEDKLLTYEEQLFKDLVAEVLEQSNALENTARALAELDLYVGWAKLAREWDYCCPQISTEAAIEITQGRHPVVEQMIDADPQGLSGSRAFVPNDTLLSCSHEQIALITGPNMAGKSTYIRQVALITLMAQVGCWVPATQCRIGIVDRIFSRVGASDELARGNSTFMVEMNETANILNNATDRSLIILDEIGRGTSTYDGLSIAWAVLEHLHSEREHGPRTLFATHYHELTQLSSTLPRLKNYSVSVKEWNDEIIFVRQVVPGAADRSYGIQVARLAGLPKSVIGRAQTILNELETEGEVVQAHLKQGYSPPKTKARAPRVKEDKDEQAQLQLF